MGENSIVHQFSFKTRLFSIARGCFENEGTEYFQLNELVMIETKASDHFSMTDSKYEKPKPLIFVTRSVEDPEIQVSMYYEGLPLEILTRFIRFVKNQWSTK